MDTKKEYVAPKLTVVSFKMEQGYASSGLFHLALFESETDYYYTNSQENWQSDNAFGDSW